MNSVSVILPTFNRWHYLSDSIESALNQTLAPLEIIVVDDGSTDGTQERVREIQARAPHLVYIRQANAGVGAARNTGLRAAKGDLIAFLDSDDRWEPNKLEIQTQFLAAHPEVDLVCSDFHGFNESGWYEESFLRGFCRVVDQYDRKLDKIFPQMERFPIAGGAVDAFSGNVFDVMVQGYLTLTSTVVLRRRAFEQTGFFVEDLPAGSDYEYYLRVGRHFNVALIDTPLASYRRGHSDALSSDANSLKCSRVAYQLAQSLQQDREYYNTHRTLVQTIGRDRRLALAYDLFSVGLFRESAILFARCEMHFLWRRPPWGGRKRFYRGLVQSVLRSLGPQKALSGRS